MLTTSRSIQKKRGTVHAVFISFCLLIFGMSAQWLYADSFDQSPIFELEQSEIRIINPLYFSTREALAAEQVLKSKQDYNWQTFNHRSLKPNDRNASLWITFQLNASDFNREEWVFVLTWSILEHAQVHTINNRTGELWTSKPIGIDYPVTQRYFNSRQVVFPLPEVENDSFTVLLEIRSSNLLTFPASVMTKSEFLKADIFDTLVIGAAIGSLFVMFLYNLSLFWALRDSSYFYYSLYIITVTFYALAASGIGYVYLWDDNAWLKLKAFPIFSSISFIAMILFVRDFLQLKQYNQSFMIGNNIFMALWGVMLVISMIFEEAWVISLLSLLAVLSCCFGIVIATFLTFKKNTDAKIFIFAWSIFIVSSTIFVSALYGLLPFNAITRYSQMIGIILELVFLSFALAYRINDVKKTRELAQQEALVLTKRVSDERRERLKAQLETLDVHKRMNDNLEREVELRTQQLEATKLKLENMNAELVQLSVTDPLSGIHNRRYFDDKLIDECKRAYRAKQPLAVIIADIDHFKPINDNFGHVVGDECIRKTANALKSVVRRPSDLLARYGGEEFVLILPNGDLEEATQVAENCRIAVEDLLFEYNGKRINLTISAGVASWVPTKESSYKELLKAADSALYLAKNSGRNCVQTSEISELL